MAKALVAIAVLLLLCAPARCAVFPVQAGTTSTDGNWILRGYYPLNVLSGFAIQQGDSIVFSVGGFAKAITITDRLFIPIVDDVTGAFDPAFTTPSSSFPITVTDPSNETYTSGFLAVGASVEFIFATPGSFEIFEIMEGKVVATIVVNPTGIPATHSPVQVARYLADAISQDELEGFKNFAAATDASTVAAGSLAMSFSSGTVSYVGFVGGNPVTVVIGTSLKFISRDVRPLNVFVNTSNEFNVPVGIPFGGAAFLKASGDGIGVEGSSVSSGIIYAGGTFSILFSSLGTYAWHSTIGGFSGNITVVNPPPKLKPLAGGRAFAAFVVVVAVLLLIFLIGCIVIIICKQACIQAKTFEARVEKGFSDLHLTDNL